MKFGDIIIITNYIGEDGTDLSGHSFIVISDEEGEVKGLPYDLVCSVMTTIKEEKLKQGSYSNNWLKITANDRNTNPENGKSALIKADQLYYFRKNSIDTIQIGCATKEIMDELIELIGYLDQTGQLKVIIDNLTR